MYLRNKSLSPSTMDQIEEKVGMRNVWCPLWGSSNSLNLVIIWKQVVDVVLLFQRELGSFIKLMILLFMFSAK